MNDEENQVRVSALEALSEMLTLSEDGMWSEDCLRKQVLPLVQAFYDAVGKGKDWVLVEGAARLLGQLCHGMRRRGVYCVLMCYGVPIVPIVQNASFVRAKYISIII